MVRRGAAGGGVFCFRRAKVFQRFADGLVEFGLGGIPAQHFIRNGLRFFINPA